MSTGNIRKGITQAKFNEDAVNIIFVEIIIIQLLLVFITKVGTWVEVYL